MAKEQVKKENKKSEKAQKGKRKILTGEVVSNKMEKTVVVKVTTTKAHPKYGKIVRTSKRYKAHAEKEIALGKKVRIQECRPMSREKRWRVVEIIEK